jgi:hypothetical protein
METQEVSETSEHHFVPTRLTDVEGFIPSFLTNKENNKLTNEPAN